MKKLFRIVISILIIIGLVACNSSKTPADPNARYYGTYETIRMESMDDRFTQDIMDKVFIQMRDDKQLFYFELGETSYIYNPDEKGGFIQYEINVDYVKNQFSTSETDVIDFKFEDGNLIVEDISSQVRFVMSKDHQ